MSAELVQLRSFYLPEGVLLLAREHDDAVGCVGLRVLGPVTGEIRRLYVRPGYRAAGLGRQLMECALSHARSAGLQRVVLTTLPTMTAAASLYASFGFGPVESYVSEPVQGVETLGRPL